MSLLPPLDFQRPIGAEADLKEIEYVSALHQTGKVLRRDGSILAKDIARYLLSRHGIRVTKDEVQTKILKVFGGGEEEEECIDMSELTAILMIPVLLKASRSILSAPSDDGTPSSYKVERSRNEFHTAWEYKEYVRKRELSMTLQLENPNEVLTDVLNLILRDAAVGTSGAPPAITERLIQELLLGYGESDLAADTDLVRQMVSAVATETGGVLDVHAFTKALTSDVTQYNTENELEPTTHFQDVFGKDVLPSDSLMDSITIQQEDNFDRDAEDQLFEAESGSVASPPKQVFTAAALDRAADTCRSKRLVVLLWANFLLTYYYLRYGPYGDSFVDTDCSGSTQEIESFKCELLGGILTWIINAVALAISGLLYIGLNSIGNNANSLSTVAGAIGVVAGTGWTLCLIIIVQADFLVANADQLGTGESVGGEYIFFFWLILILSITINLHQISQLVAIVGQRFFRRRRRWFLPPNIVSGARIKQAAAFKLNRMVKNAHQIHLEDDGAGQYNASHGRALLQFSKHSHKYEKFTLSWAWEAVFNRKHCAEEGIWLSSRLISGVFMQLCAVLLLFTVLSLKVVNIVAANTPDPSCNSTEFTDIFVTFGKSCMLNCTSPDHQIVEDMYCVWNCLYSNPCHPTFPSWSVTTAAIVGLCFGFMATLLLIINYIPSFICTTLKMRTGIIPTLEDRYFQDYREAMDGTSNILGSMFWGTFITGGLIAIVVAVVVFFFIAPLFRSLCLDILALVIGFFITISLKQCLLVWFRIKSYRSFYRRRPAVTNIVGLALECWNIALAVGFVTARSIRILIATFFYMGRIDIPMLNTNTRIGPLHVDFYPMLFRKDILLHEAHRHPYIETLGTIYLYKLRYDDKFGSLAGSTWRLLFVVALFPWLRKHRLMTRPRLAREVDLPTSRDLAEENAELRSIIASLQQQMLEYAKNEGANDCVVAISVGEEAEVDEVS